MRPSELFHSSKPANNLTDVKEVRDPSTLPEDIYALLADENDHEVSEENVSVAGELFMQLLRDRLKKREVKKGQDVLRFSAIGKSDRQLWYQANMPEVAEKMGGQKNFQFLYGDVIEILLLFLAMESGHTVTDTQKQVECDGVFGSIDAKIDGILVDSKSASPYSFDKFKTGAYVFDDPFGYVSQLSAYANALGVDRAGFLVANKVDGEICFTELDKVYIEGNKPSDRIDHLRKSIRSDVPPPRCHPLVEDGKSGNLKLPVECSYCPFKFECYKDANGGKGLRKFFYSRGPVFLAKVVKEPKVDEA